ncbi:MAG: shikimate kinase [Saprospiraceae bacterium]|jgi:shikimate kinase
MRIILTGFMGSGKSYTGRRLADLMQLPYFDLDAEIESGEKKRITDIFTQNGEAHFRRLERKYLEQIILQHSKVIVSTGGGTPCFLGNDEFMLTHGMVVFFDTDYSVLAERLQKESEHRPLLNGKSIFELEEFIAQKIEQRLPYYQNCHVVFEQRKSDMDVAGELYGAFSQLVGH